VVIVPVRMSSCSKSCIVATVTSSPFNQYYATMWPWQWLRDAQLKHVFAGFMRSENRNGEAVVEEYLRNHQNVSAEVEGRLPYVQEA
jgi:hypothetical protein